MSEDNEEFVEVSGECEELSSEELDAILEEVSLQPKRIVKQVVAPQKIEKPIEPLRLGKASPKWQTSQMGKPRIISLGSVQCPACNQKIPKRDGTILYDEKGEATNCFYHCPECGQIFKKKVVKK